MLSCTLGFKTSLDSRRNMEITSSILPDLMELNWKPTLRGAKECVQTHGDRNSLLNNKWVNKEIRKKM